MIRRTTTDRVARTTNFTPQAIQTKRPETMVATGSATASIGALPGAVVAHIIRQGRSIIRVATLSFFLSLLTFGAILAQNVEDRPSEPPKLTENISFQGDPVLCRELFEDAKNVRYIEPYRDMDVASDLYIGESGVPRRRIYFTHRAMPWTEVRRRIDGRDWVGLLGDPPDDIEQVPGLVSNDPWWRSLKKRCPEFFHTRDRDGNIYAAPEQMALYRADLDNDGNEDTVLFRAFIGYGRYSVPRSEEFEIAYLDTCQLKPLYWSTQESKLIKWRYITFIEKRSWGDEHRSTTLMMKNKDSDDSGDGSDRICSFYGFNGFDQLLGTMKRFDDTLK